MYKRPLLSGVLCAALLAATLSGCGAKPTSSTTPTSAAVSTVPQEKAETAYEAAQNALSQAKGLDLGIAITMKLVAAEASQNIQVTGTYKHQPVDAQTANIETAMSLSVPGLEEPVETALTYVDGWLYANAMGETYKTQMTTAEAADMLADTLDVRSFASLAETTALQNMTGVSNGEKTVISYTVNEESLSQAMNNLLTSLLGTDTASTDDMTTTGTVTVDKDGTPKEITAITTVSMESENTAINMEIASTVTINALNDDVVITAPADGDTYTEQAISKED